MIANQILQNTIDGLKAIARVDLCLIDAEGIVIATTFQETKEQREAVMAFAGSAADSQVLQDCQYFKIFDERQLEYILLVRGASEDVYMIGKMAAFQISGLLVAYKERFDKDNFIKNLLLDNLLLIDIYNRAKKLHIDTAVRRVVFIVETKYEKDNGALETIKTLFIGKNKAFITAVDERNIIIVKELKPNEDYEDLEKTAHVIVDMVNTEAMTQAYAAYGTIVNDLKEVSRSYKEAKVALDVGKIFYSTKNVMAYGNLGIGRLIYQLPLPLCKMFIKEIFKDAEIDEFGEEALMTIDVFLENSCNVSAASKQLFVHRNTLVYRLDKIQKATGLNLRKFKDAMTVRIALMVIQYMKYMESIER